jgi:CRISPR-associated endonuclease Cas1
MPATATVAQLPLVRKHSHHAVVHLSPKTFAPRSGVITLHGYGIRVQVERGHLLLSDGIASDCQQYRLPRIGHGLERLIVIGNDGLVSLSALRWLADQNAAFVMLERDGKVLCVTGPVRSSDARLRRAQALAHQSEAALRIAKELIGHKLAGQERVAREKLSNSECANAVSSWRSELEVVTTTAEVRHIESQAAIEYWGAWRDLPITFPKNDLVRTPEHWRRFDTRKSILTGSPRLATNPCNAILNYLYCVLESESRLAVAALGLDPGLGFIHMDAPARDSLACDLMEVVRPSVDAYVLDWIIQHTLKRDWFFEQRDGTCRLMGSFAVRLSETAPKWRHAIAPIAEWIARNLWTRKSGQCLPPTRLTQSRRREAQGGSTLPMLKTAPKHEKLCQQCGARIGEASTHCHQCARIQLSEHFAGAAQLGRQVSHNKQAEDKRKKKQQLNAKALRSWNPSKQPAWLTAAYYEGKIQPRLAALSNAVIARTINVSRGYAAEIRKGRVAHPRHWRALASLLGVIGTNS